MSRYLHLRRRGTARDAGMFEFEPSERASTSPARGAVECDRLGQAFGLPGPRHRQALVAPRSVKRNVSRVGGGWRVAPRTSTFCALAQAAEANSNTSLGCVAESPVSFRRCTPS